MFNKVATSIINRGLRSPLAILSAATLGLGVCKDAYKLRKGTMDGIEFSHSTGGRVGGTALGAAGALIGQTVLGFVPIVGRPLGALAGAMLGEAAGSKVGRSTAQRIWRRHVVQS